MAYPRSVQIYPKDLSGKLYVLNYNPGETTIEELKNEISRQTGVDVKYIRFVYGNRILHNDQIYRPERGENAFHIVFAGGRENEERQTRSPPVRHYAETAERRKIAEIRREMEKIQKPTQERKSPTRRPVVRRRERFVGSFNYNNISQPQIGSEIIINVGGEEYDGYIITSILPRKQGNNNDDEFVATYDDEEYPFSLIAGEWKIYGWIDDRLFTLDDDHTIIFKR